MGVDKTDYLIVGYKIPYEVKTRDGQEFAQIIWEEKYMPMTEGHNGEKYSLIIDGMSGEYIVFGIVIQSADEYEGFKFTVIDEKLLTTQLDEVKDRANEIFNDLDFDFSEPKVMLFSHYS